MSAYTQQTDRQSQPQVPSTNRNRRRCSICGDTQHDRRFHTLAERAYQVNTINENREIRRLAHERRHEEHAVAHENREIRRLAYERRQEEYAVAHQMRIRIQSNTVATTTPVTTRAVIPARVAIPVEPIHVATTATVINTNDNSDESMRAMIQHRQQQHIIKKRYFKYILLQSIGREEKYISNILTRVREIANTEYNGYLIQYALEMGSPPRPHFNDYVFRIVSLLYVWFNDIKINSIDDIIIGDLFMKKPDIWYCDYYTSIATKQKKEKLLLIHQLKLRRIDNLIVYQKLPTHCDTNIDENSQIIDCPICYENKHKLLCVQSNCNHHFCRDCFNEFVINTKLIASLHCPMCRNELTSIIAFN
jgi:hypothetical protein